MDVDIVRTHQAGVAELDYLVGANAGIGADHVSEDAQPIFAGSKPLVLVDPGAEREGDELVGRVEVLFLNTLNVIRPFLGCTGAARIAVEGAYPGVFEAFDQGIAVGGRIGYLGQIGDGGDAGVDRPQRAGKVTHIGVLRPVLCGSGSRNIAEIIGQQPVREHIAKRALVEMMMRIVETRQHDHVRRIDH